MKTTRRKFCIGAAIVAGGAVAGLSASRVDTSRLGPALLDHSKTSTKEDFQKALGGTAKYDEVIHAFLQENGGVEDFPTWRKNVQSLLIFGDGATKHLVVVYGESPERGGEPVWSDHIYAAPPMVRVASVNHRFKPGWNSGEYRKHYRIWDLGWRPVSEHEAERFDERERHFDNKSGRY